MHEGRSRQSGTITGRRKSLGRLWPHIRLQPRAKSNPTCATHHCEHSRRHSHLRDCLEGLIAKSAVGRPFFLEVPHENKTIVFGGSNVTVPMCKSAKICGDSRGDTGPHVDINGAIDELSATVAAQTRLIQGLHHYLPSNPPPTFSSTNLAPWRVQAEWRPTTTKAVMTAFESVSWSAAKRVTL
jgi:hypothetical protein